MKFDGTFFVNIVICFYLLLIEPLGHMIYYVNVYVYQYILQLSGLST
jgi:hypothetical protein